MSTTPLTDGMQALINYANETTGETDTTLSDAIDSLVSGYGQGGGSSDFECVIDTEFEITETNETTTATLVGEIDLSEYGTCREMCSKDGNVAHFVLLIDLLIDKDTTKTYTVKRAMLVSYTTVVFSGRSGNFTSLSSFYGPSSTCSNQQINVSGYWDNGKIDVTSRHVAAPDVYAVKGTYRARIFKINI